MAAKFAGGEDFTLDDFLQQLNAVRNMGSLKKMLGMLPGMAQVRDQLDAFDEREFDRIEAMVRSMTPLERRQPRIMNGSRRARVAKGCGQSVSAVNDMLERFGQAQKMMRQMRKGLGGGVPGMPGMPGAAGAGSKKQKARVAAAKGKKGKSGNPAKRAEQEKAALTRSVEAKENAGSAFGVPEPGQEFDASQLNLPKGFDRFLGGR